MITTSFPNWSSHICFRWKRFPVRVVRKSWGVSCTRLRILLNTICRKPGFNSLRTPLNHGAEQVSNETLKQTLQRNWSNASQGGQTALKERLAVLHSETASTTQQPRGEHRGTIKNCKIAGATTWQRQGNHTCTTVSLRLGDTMRTTHAKDKIWTSNFRSRLRSHWYCGKNKNCDETKWA